MAKKGKTMLGKRAPPKPVESAFGKLASSREAAEIKRKEKVVSDYEARGVARSSQKQR